MKKIKISRLKLYEEIWEKRIGLVAQDYNISLADMRKVCDLLNVPRPSSGHWAKLLYGKDSPIVKLPSNYNGNDIIEFFVDDSISSEDRIIWNTNSNFDNPIAYLTDKMVWLVSSESKREFYDDLMKHFEDSKDIKLSKNFKDFRNGILATKKSYDKLEQQAAVHNIVQTIKYSWKKKRPVINVRLLSSQTIERVFLFISKLEYILERFNCSLNDDLTASVLEQNIWYSFYEGQRKIDHVLTIKDKQALKNYERDVARGYTLWREPQIRKYDYIFNGNLTLSFDFGNKSIYKDSKNRTLESYIPEIILEILKFGFEENTRKKELTKNQMINDINENINELVNHRYNHELNLTSELLRMSHYFDEAERIRRMISSIEENEQNSAWIDFAKKKADWLDPSIHSIDAILGENKYEKDIVDLLNQPSIKPNKKWRY